MKKTNVLKVCVLCILILCCMIIFYFNNKTIMLSLNLQNDITKYWNKDVNIKAIEDFEINDKKFKVVLSTATDNDKYKYLSCYEEKLSGLYYKFYQGSEQGKSNAMFNISTISVFNNGEEHFTVVYGDNRDSNIVNYKIKLSSAEGSMFSNIENEDYFLDIAIGSYENIVSAIDKDGNDMAEVFYD